MNDLSIDELAEGLSEFEEPRKPEARSAVEQRVLAGFEEVERFVERHGREPQEGEGRDIFERLYAVRLGRLQRSVECRAILRDADPRGLLGPEPAAAGAAADEPNLDELSKSLADLAGPDDDVTRLVHVRSPEEIRAAEEVAQRTRCEDFDAFRPLFDRAQQELTAEGRRTVPFKYRDNQAIDVGDWFVLDGQKTYVASGEKLFKAEHGEWDRRLRVVYDNGTESNLLMRSLRRALNKDEHSRRIQPPDADAAPLFAGDIGASDTESGTIYVLQSKSAHPFVVANRTTIHKIGVTGGEVKARTANAKKDATYLLADVDVVATYRLANVNRKGLEALLHRVFAAARLDLTLKDRFGAAVEPREWFLVPLPAINESIDRLRAGTLGDFRYDPEQARLVPV